MIGNIYINGEIGQTATGVGVMLIDVMGQVKSQPEATSFNVIINSVGGCVSEGWKIANYLKSLGLPTNGIGKEIVASISTVIFGSCTTREMLPNCKFMMHLPMGDPGGGGTADELDLFTKRVREEEDKLVKFYSELMGFDKDTIKSLISTDTYLTSEQTEAFGITTKEPTKIVAKAYFNLNTDKQMSNLTKEEANSWFEKIEAKLAQILKPKIVNKVLQDANGVSLDFENVADDATPVVTDTATVDGAPAEGDYLMPNGETFVFVGGELTEIKPEESADDSEEMEALKTENAEFAAKVEALEAEKVELETSISNMEKDVKELKSKITSKLEIEKRDSKIENKTENRTRKFFKD